MNRGARAAVDRLPKLGIEEAREPVKQAVGGGEPGSDRATGAAGPHPKENDPATQSVTGSQLACSEADETRTRNPQIDSLVR